MSETLTFKTLIKGDFIIRYYSISFVNHYLTSYVHLTDFLGSANHKINNMMLKILKIIKDIKLKDLNHS